MGCTLHILPDVPLLNIVAALDLSRSDGAKSEVWARTLGLPRLVFVGLRYHLWFWADLEVRSRTASTFSEEESRRNK